MLKNILFDLDGTLMDSKQCIFTVYTMLFNEMNITVPVEKELEKFIGPPVEEMLKRYVKEEEVKKYCNRFRELYKGVDLFNTNFPYVGIKELLATLSKKYKLFVTTTKNEPLAIKILEGFDLAKYFVGIYGSISSIGRVDKKDVINEAIKQNNLLKEESLLIGDTIFDVEGAEQANVKVALVTYGYGVETDFIGKKIEFYANSSSDILNKLEKYEKSTH